MPYNNQNMHPSNPLDEFLDKVCAALGLKITAERWSELVNTLVAGGAPRDRIASLKMSVAASFWFQKGKASWDHTQVVFQPEFMPKQLAEWGKTGQLRLAAQSVSSSAMTHSLSSSNAMAQSLSSSSQPTALGQSSQAVTRHSSSSLEKSSSAKVLDVFVPQEKWEAVIAVMRESGIRLPGSAIKDTISNILWMGQSGAQWSQIDPLVRRRFHIWNQKKVLAKVLKLLDYPVGWRVDAHQVVSQSSQAVSSSSLEKDSSAKVLDVFVPEEKWEAVIAVMRESGIKLLSLEIKDTILNILWVGQSGAQWSQVDPLMRRRFHIWNKKKVLAQVLKLLDYPAGWRVDAHQVVSRENVWPKEYEALGLNQDKGVLKTSEWIRLKSVYRKLIASKKIKGHFKTWKCCVEMFFWMMEHPHKSWEEASKRYGVSSAKALFMQWQQTGVWDEVLKTVGGRVLGRRQSEKADVLLPIPQSAAESSANEYLQNETDVPVISIAKWQKLAQVLQVFLNEDIKQAIEAIFDCGSKGQSFRVIKSRVGQRAYVYFRSWCQNGVMDQITQILDPKGIFEWDDHTGQLLQSSFHEDSSQLTSLPTVQVDRYHAGGVSSSSATRVSVEAASIALSIPSVNNQSVNDFEDRFPDFEERGFTL